MQSKYMLLWFESPLQSWGYDSKFNRRETLEFPTKSGVTGLILCALGASGAQNELLENLKDMKQTVISFSNIDENNEKIKLTNHLEDFQVIGNGYEYENEDWFSLHIPCKKCGSKSSIISYKYYLQNAKFAVIFEIPGELSDSFSYALQNPIYNIYLGRKNCIPTDFIFRNVFDNEEEALKEIENIKNEKKIIEAFKVVDGEEEGEIFFLNDVPLQFGQQKIYKDRKVTKISYE